MIQDILQDVIKYVHGVGVFPAVRIVQTKDGIELFSTNAEKTVVLNASSKLKFSDEEIVFGLGNLDMLQKILDCPEYKENVNISLGTDAGSKLDRVEFENATGDFHNQYRLMNQKIVETIVPSNKFMGAKWSVEFVPPVSSIQRFNLQAAVNSSESSFVMKANNKNIEVSFGTPATHSGKFVFANNLPGKVVGDLPFSVPVFQKVLNLSSHAQSATLKIAERGLMCMTLDSGLVEYNYYIMGLSK
jgi:hypothetical protein